MKPSLEGKKFSLKYNNNYDPNLELNIDIHLIEQVLINLILNAKDACEDKPEGKIMVNAEMLRDGVQIRVIDNGKGIPTGILDNIFVPFFSTKNTGSGIGLSLSKQIILLHNGHIQVQSEVGKGSTISIMFN